MTTIEVRVAKTSPDDNDGSRHQRFVIELSAAELYSSHTTSIWQDAFRFRSAIRFASIGNMSGTSGGRDPLDPR